jgi:NAD(P)-dependent dehydrogenase (short-subunit alcohol dehydrogenase family)
MMRTPTATGRLDGRIALITGGASGLGLAACRLFVAEGARVLVADIQQEAGRDVEREFGDRVSFSRCDVREESDIERSVAQAISRFGGLDVCYHSAGAVGDRGTVETMTVEGWDTTHSLLLRSAMLLVKHAVQPMKARGGGSIILTSSAAATSLGGSGQYAYSVAKAAVLTLGQFAALKLAPDRIRVNTIVPGSIPTAIWGGLLDGAAPIDPSALDGEAFARMQPLPRPGRPGDVAEAALYLASDAAIFVTGVCLPVDGGLSLFRPEAGSGANPTATFARASVADAAQSG